MYNIFYLIKIKVVDKSFNKINKKKKEDKGIKNKLNLLIKLDGRVSEQIYKGI